MKQTINGPVGIGIGVVVILVLSYVMYSKFLKEPSKRTPEMGKEEMRKAMESQMKAQGPPRTSGAPGMQMGGGR